ncbi:DUF5067 domain-containing protein [uncultured Eubacterium sp.]|uniref:DUF5067 domain-containing protein n=1 Tax=uncultured Eubacterium sp. TaxID=165185 RepID=UPI0025F63CA8|nr:DUF5067 domain-containing protein [uncultured Eubacterium sp.]
MANNNFQQQNNPEVQQAVNAALNEEKKKKKKKKKLIILGVIIAVIIVIAVAASGSESNDDTNTSSNENTTVSSVNAEKKETDENTIGDFKCIVKGAKLTKDWEGKDAVLITYEFTNNSDSPISFDGALDDKLYQDGIELESAILSNDEEAKLIDAVDLKPGITKEVKKAYSLRNKKSEIEVEIQEVFSFSDDMIKTTINL